MKILALLAIVLSSLTAFAQGACPSGIPTGITGNHCYFVSASGSDSNNGTTESTPWLHAPGMPNCSGTCATVQTSWGSDGDTPHDLAGIGLIFRGGDTWHFGNSGASPYTGGTWDIYWGGDNANCSYDGTLTSCFYLGVDPTWYNSGVCGGSWCRPIMNGDNPTSTSLVSSCSYYPIGANNVMIVLKNLNTYLYMDSFELLGLCSNDTTNDGSANWDSMIYDAGLLSDNLAGIDFEVNFYAHGWTATTGTSTNGAIACNVLGGGALQAKIRDVVDGSDSDAGVCAWGIFQDNWALVDSMIRYTTQGVGANCHIIHDNIFEYMAGPYVPTHGNVMECNTDYTSLTGQPTTTANVVYNNIFRHDATSVSSNPDLWLCPNTLPEYWFNNVMYDLDGEGWSIAGPGQYSSCNNQGGQYMFNNTLVDLTQPCSLNSINNGTNGQYLTIVNEHLINAPLDTFISPGCTGRTSSTNIAQSDSTGTSQGYTTGSAGTSQSNSCADDTTTPCIPTSHTASTVGAGTNEQAYCSAMAALTADPAISTDAANACKYATTDACTYNSGTHTMSCPAQTATQRPLSLAWDSGAYQYLQTVLGIKLAAGINLRSGARIH